MSLPTLAQAEKEPFKIVAVIRQLVEKINGITEGAWTAYSPTVTSNTGTITTLGTVTGRYKQFGKTVFFQASAIITTNGTGAGYVNFTLPATAAAFSYFAVGQELDVTGNMLIGHIVASTANLAVTNTNGTYPGGDGRRLVLSGAYESA